MPQSTLVGSKLSCYDNTTEALCWLRDREVIKRCDVHVTLLFIKCFNWKYLKQTTQLMWSGQDTMISKPKTSVNVVALSLTFSILIAHFEHKLGSDASGVCFPATEICAVWRYCGFFRVQNCWVTSEKQSSQLIKREKCHPTTFNEQRFIGALKAFNWRKLIIYHKVTFYLLERFKRLACSGFDWQRHTFCITHFISISDVVQVRVRGKCVVFS